jgi:predicted kinase
MPIGIRVYVIFIRGRFDQSFMEILIFIGIPGSGKSTFYFERFADTHVRINLDTLKTRRREMALVRACLATQRSMVIDNTNVTAAERARYIPLACMAGYQITGYYFQSTLAEALLRNRARTGKALVPEKGVRARFNQLEPPQVSEGFDRLYTVRIDPITSEFNVEETGRT